MDQVMPLLLNHFLLYYNLEWVAFRMPRLTERRADNERITYYYLNAFNIIVQYAVRKNIS